MNDREMDEPRVCGEASAALRAWAASHPSCGKHPAASGFLRFEIWDSFRTSPREHHLGLGAPLRSLACFLSCCINLLWSYIVIFTC